MRDGRKHRKHRLIRMSTVYLEQFLSCPNSPDRVTSEVPEGTKILSVSSLPFYPHEIRILVEHESFDLIPDDEEPPEWTPVFTQHREVRDTQGEAA